MAFDIKQFLTECGVKPEGIEAVLPHLSGADVVANVEKHTLRLSDYSKQMDSLRADQTKLNEANDRLNAEILDWQKTATEGGEVTKRMEKSLATAKAEVARLQTVITTRAEQLGVDPKEILGDEPAVAQPPAVAHGDDLNTLTATVNNRFNNMADYFMTLPAELLTLANEHQALTGETLDTRTIMAEVKRRATDKGNRNSDGSLKKPVDARMVWEETHAVAAKREAKSKAEYDKAITDAEARGREAALSSQQLPGDPPQGRHSPVFRKAGETREHLIQHTQRPSNTGQRDRVSAAATAIRDGRYRDKNAGRPAA